jgi:hypothetical protein
MSARSIRFWNRDVVESLFGHQIDHGVSETVPGALDPTVRLLFGPHRLSFLNIKKVFVHYLTS